MTDDQREAYETYLERRWEADREEGFIPRILWPARDAAERASLDAIAADAVAELGETQVHGVVETLGTEVPGCPDCDWTGMIDIGDPDRRDPSGCSSLTVECPRCNA